MKDLTVVYKWDDGKEGTFVKKDFPEPLDMAATCISPEDFDDPAQADAAAESLAESKAFQAMYWGWFRQVLVTWRADAKRARKGGKTVAGQTEAEVAKAAASWKLPEYAEPSEQQDKVSKLAGVIGDLAPEELAALLAKAGINVVSGRQ